MSNTSSLNVCQVTKFPRKKIEISFFRKFGMKEIFNQGIFFFIICRAVLISQPPYYKVSFISWHYYIEELNVD